MRKGKTSLILLILLCMSSQLVAQTKRNTFKLNPLSVFVLTANFQIERQINERFSFQFGAFAGGTSLGVLATELPNGVRYRWWGLTPELRYFISFNRMEVPTGFYVAPFLRLQHANRQFPGEAFDPDTQTNLAGNAILRTNSFGGGFLLGYQFITKTNFVLDLFMGPKYSSANSKVNFECTGCNGNETLNNSPGLKFDGIEPRAGIGLGFAF